LRKMMIGWLLQGPTPSLTNVMNSRRLMLPQGNDGTLSRNDGWFVALHCKFGGRLLLRVLAVETRRAGFRLIRLGIASGFGAGEQTKSGRDPILQFSRLCSSAYRQ
jgi:hypothetical protein